MTDDLLKGGDRASVIQLPVSDNFNYPQGSVITHMRNDIGDDDIRTIAPVVPMPVLMPDVVTKKAQEFSKAFTGHVMYAVKCNPDEILLRAMHKGCVKRFDVASIAEVRKIASLFPDAKMYFMHPIKAPEAISEAYFKYGVRAFVLDYDGEMHKILQATGMARDLELFVRMAVPKNNPGGDVATDFSAKFGAKPAQATEFLKLCRPYAKKLGLNFHVGTQCHDPAVYSNAVGHAKSVIENSGVKVQALDVGGGFPAELNSDHPVPPVERYTTAIADAIQVHNLGALELLCEVGRGLVACGGSLIVRVEGRKGDLLYLNDGTYGGIFEGGGAIGLPYPARLIRRDDRTDHGAMMPFRFAGPTCDSVDMLNGPFMLPDDIAVGDWIRLEQLGAYGEVSRTDFNGFGMTHKIVVQAERRQRQRLHKIA